MPTQRMRIKAKKSFLKVLSSVEVNGNISKACEVTGWSRQSISTWRKEDISFDKAIESVVIEAREDLADLAENALREKIKSGDTKAILFTLKSLNKAYQEATEPSTDKNNKEENKSKSTIFTGERAALYARLEARLAVSTYKPHKDLNEEENKQLFHLSELAAKRRMERVNVVDGKSNKYL